MPRDQNSGRRQLGDAGDADVGRRRDRRRQRQQICRRLRQIGHEWRSDQGYAFFIFQQEGGQLVGGVNLSNVRRGVAQVASLGYWMGEAFAHRGLMHEALTALLPYAFERLGLHRIEAACLPWEGAVLRFTCSAGVAEHVTGQTAVQTLSRADEALYRAKEQGRNCVRLSIETAVA